MDARDRERLGRAFYVAYAFGYFARPWADLPDHDRERYRIAAEVFIRSSEVADILDRVHPRIAA